MLSISLIRRFGCYEMVLWNVICSILEKLCFLKEENAKLSLLVYTFTGHNIEIIKSVPIFKKWFPCDKDSNLNQEGFSMLLYHVSIRNPVCNAEKTHYETY